MLQVVIADDHRLVRRSIRRLLETAGDISVVGEADGGLEALEKVRTLLPDILLLDMDMDDMDGFEVLRALQGQTLPRVIMVTMHTGRELVKRALAAGAKGYVSKQLVAEELIEAVKAVGAGRAYLCKRVRTTLFAQ